MTSRFVVLPSAEALAAAAADRVVAAARNAIRRRGRFIVALSGGSTPRAAYSLLATAPRATAVDWSRVTFFWADERAVPLDDPQSNCGVARVLLLSRLRGVRQAEVQPMPAFDPDRAAAAMRYQSAIARAFGVPADAPRPPAFDLVWLGMGADGHTASLFPGSPALLERRRWVVPCATSSGAPRMTLTLPIINAARAVLFLVAGADKAPALHLVRGGTGDLPAGLVRARSTLWLLDPAAAGHIGVAG